MFGLTILFYTCHEATADTGHVDGTKHGLSIVGSYVTLPLCILFITLTLIIQCNIF